MKIQKIENVEPPKITMECAVCETSDWQNIDEVRVKPSGMCMCKNCGFISYPDKWKSKEEIFEHYRTAYRKPPGVMNVYTGQRKNHYHAKFLGEYFTKWKKEKKDPVVAEIGSAFGMTVHWLKTLFPKADITGTELTTSMKRVAFHEWGITLLDDFDRSKKYDLIMTYKVAEHQLDIHKELMAYKECLTPDGRLYISIPTWFDAAINFGLSGFDLEYYYDTNHVNVWTKKHFKTLLKKIGFEIVKQDHVMYGSTYLCKRNDALMSETPQYENPAEIFEKAKKLKEAFLAFSNNNFQKAVELWPNYPHAWVNLFENNRKDLAEKGFKWFEDNRLAPALDACRDAGAYEILVSCADYSMRAKDWRSAIQYVESSLEMRPESPASLNQMIMTMRELAIAATNEKEKAHYFQQAIDACKHLRLVSLQHYPEAMELLFSFQAHLPVPATSPEPVATLKPPKPLSTSETPNECTL